MHAIGVINDLVFKHIEISEEMWGVQDRDGHCEVGTDQRPYLWKEEEEEEEEEENDDDDDDNNDIKNRSVFLDKVACYLAEIFRSFGEFFFLRLHVIIYTSLNLNQTHTSQQTVISTVPLSDIHNLLFSIYVLKCNQGIFL